MNNHPFKCGLIVGRFQGFHIGHEDMIRKALMMCDKVCVYIGSSQESGTKHNPFDYADRYDAIYRVFEAEFEDGRLFIEPLPDANVGNNSKWGDYVISSCIESFCEVPDLIVTAQESCRVDWFENYRDSIASVAIPKAIDIHGTDIRRLLREGKFNEWMHVTPQELWYKYNEYRNTILQIKDGM